MPLTPEDVSNKRFTAVRLREGYDMGEVDAFLDRLVTGAAAPMATDPGAVSEQRGLLQRLLRRS